jgi:hypothetical protein
MAAQVAKVRSIPRGFASDAERLKALLVDTSAATRSREAAPGLSSDAESSRRLAAPEL